MCARLWETSSLGEHSGKPIPRGCLAIITPTTSSLLLLGLKQTADAFSLRLGGPSPHLSSGHRPASDAGPSQTGWYQNWPNHRPRRPVCLFVMCHLPCHPAPRASKVELPRATRSGVTRPILARPPLHRSWLGRVLPTPAATTVRRRVSRSRPLFCTLWAFTYRGA